jgi:cell cycle checkpoint control protein RAD9A
MAMFSLEAEFLQALMSVFKSRLSDPRGFNAIDRCEAYIKEQADEAECRFVVKMFCDRGMVSIYNSNFAKLTVYQVLSRRIN